MNLIKRLSNRLTKVQWNIGFIDYHSDNFFSSEKVKIKYLKHSYKNKWFADPFILDITKDKIILFVEEFDEIINKGRIAKLVVNRQNYRLESMKIILDLKSHLSFPVIYRIKNIVFVCPENSESGGYYKYTYDYNSEKLVNPELIIDEPLTDAIKYYISDKPYIFSTKQPNSDGNKIYIYCDEFKNDQYRFKQEIILEDNTARGAGNFIKLKDKLIRPAQDCNKSYGNGLVFQEIMYDNGLFSVNELKRIYNKTFKYGLGIHTFNTLGNMAVVDVLGYKHIFWGRIFTAFIKISTSINKYFN